MAKSYWLMKSEPDVYSIDDLQRDKTTWWEGVRNYQARNFMMKGMKPGDGVLFYHSNAEPPGVAGLAEVTREAAPDATQFDPKSEYYDEKSTKRNPRWNCVQVGFRARFRTLVSLDDLRGEKSLSEMLVLKKGQRLSVQPVTKAEFERVKKMGGL